MTGVTPPTDDRRLRGGRLVLLTAVIVLAAATLRATFLTVAPVAREIGDDLDASATLIGLLTSIPVLCFAVFSPAAVALIRRGGADFALSLTMIGAIAGALVRVAGGIPLALVGTAIMGVFLTVGNVVIPVIVGREFSAHRAHTMTGVFTAALNVGTMTVTLATAPLAAQVGWRWAITVWVVFPIAALACWVALRGLGCALVPHRGANRAAAANRGSAWRHGPTLLLAAAFAGQAFAFYGMTAWLPSLLSDQGMSSTAAGVVAAVFQVAGVVGSLLLPALTTRASLMTGVVCVGIAWLVVPLGFLLAPSLWLAWCAVGGLAQGGGITVVFIMINALATDDGTKAGRSGTVQGVGYGVAALGPIAIGAVHEATGAWTVPLLLVLAAVVLFFAGGVLAVRALGRASV